MLSCIRALMSVPTENGLSADTVDMLMEHVIRAVKRHWANGGTYPQLVVASARAAGLGGFDEAFWRSTAESDDDEPRCAAPTPQDEEKRRLTTKIYGCGALNFQADGRTRNLASEDKPIWENGERVTSVEKFDTVSTALIPGRRHVPSAPPPSCLHVVSSLSTPLPSGGRLRA